MTEEMTQVESNEPQGTEEYGMRRIPLSQIVEPGFRLRDPQRNNEDYQNLVKDIAKRGVQQSIKVRPVTRNGVQKYEVIDGTQRFNASLDAGATDIPCIIENMTDAEAREVQIVNNLIRIKQNPAQVGDMLRVMLNEDPAATPASLAARISQPVNYVNNRLKLTKLKPEIQALVDEGSLGLMNAVMLAEFDEENQDLLLDDAMKQASDDFIPAARKRKREINQAKRAARPETHEFEARAKVRKKDVLESELTNLESGEGSLIVAYLGTHEVADNEDLRTVLAHTMKWILKLDDQTVAAEKAKWEIKEKEKAEQKERLKAEREAKKAEKEAKLSTGSVEH